MVGKLVLHRLLHEPVYIFCTRTLERIFKTCTQERDFCMQKSRKPSSGELIGYLTIGVLILAVCGTFVDGLYGEQLSTLFRGFAPSCTIGVGSATVTVKGWSANNDCQAMLAGGHDNFTGMDWSQYQAYAASSPASNVQCEFDLSGRHITIRDSGISTIGSDLCTIMRGPG